jgi:hypothetical protein
MDRRSFIKTTTMALGLGAVGNHEAIAIPRNPSDPLSKDNLEVLIVTGRSLSEAEAEFIQRRLNSVLDGLGVRAVAIPADSPLEVLAVAPPPPDHVLVFTCADASQESMDGIADYLFETFGEEVGLAVQNFNFVTIEAVEAADWAKRESDFGNLRFLAENMGKLQEDDAQRAIEVMEKCTEATMRAVVDGVVVEVPLFRPTKSQRFSKS